MEQQAIPAFSIFTLKDLWHYRSHLASRAQHHVSVVSGFYCPNQIRKTRHNCKNVTIFTCQHTLAFICSPSQMDLFLSNFSFLSIWVSFFCFYTGLEPYMVHHQSRPYPVFPKHSAGVGPLYLSVVAGSLLLPSSLLPWPWTHSDVWPLRRQNGETSHENFSQVSAFVKLFLVPKKKTVCKVNSVLFSKWSPPALLLRCWASCWHPLAVWNFFIFFWREVRRSTNTWSSYWAQSHAAWLW